MENQNFDYIIIGAGPTGLTIADGLSHLGYSCLIIEKSDVVGGCHATFPHSPCLPLVYSKTYLNFRSLHFHDSSHFKPYPVPNDMFSCLTRNEKRSIQYVIFRTLFNPNYGRNQSCADFFETCQFSKETINYFSRLIRWISNGSDVSRFTLHDLLHIYNHRLLDNLIVPKHNIKWVEHWKTHLESTRHVQFRFNTEIVDMNKHKGRILSISTTTNELIHVNDDVIFTGSILSLQKFIPTPAYLNNDWFALHKSLPQPSILFKFQSIKKRFNPPSLIVGEWGLKCLWYQKDNDLLVTITNITKQSSILQKSCLELLQMRVIDVVMISSEVIRQLRAEYTNQKYCTFSNQYSFAPFLDSADSFVYNESVDNDIFISNHNHNFFVVGPHSLQQHYRPTPFVSIETAVVSGLDFLRTRFPKLSRTFPILKSKTSTIFQSYRYKLFITFLIFILLIVGLTVGLLL